MRARGILGFVVVGVLLGFLPNAGGPLGMPPYYLVFLFSTYYWITQASSWNILSGYSGYFSFGQAAFVGSGVYTTAVLTIHYHVSFFLTILAGGAVAAILSLLLGLVAFRLRSLRGEVFTLLTLVVALVLAAIAQLSKFIDGGEGRTISVPSYPSFLGSYSDLIYRLGLSLAIITVACAFLIQNSRFGKGLFAIRDDEEVAEAFGTPTFLYKMAALGISSFFAGAAGSINSLQVSYVTVDGTFTFITPLFVILMSTLGGKRHWLGPVFGASVIYLLQQQLSSGSLASSSNILLGGILALTMLFAPDGLYPRLRNKWRSSVVLFAIVLAVEAGFGLAGGTLTQILVATLIVVLVGVLPARWTALLRSRSTILLNRSSVVSTSRTTGSTTPATAPGEPVCPDAATSGPSDGEVRVEH